MTIKTLFKNNPLLFYSITSGLALMFSWPPFGTPLVAFVAFVPLLWTEAVLLENRRENNSMHFFKLAYVTFFVFNLLTTWWIAFSTSPGMVVAVSLNSLFMATPWWLVHLWRRSSAKQGWLPLLFLWLSFEHLHSQWEINWSWLDLGNVFSTTPAIVQWYEYTGVAGGTLWILVANLFAFSLFKEIRGAKESNILASKKLLVILKSNKIAFKRASLFLSFFVVTLVLPMVISLIAFWNYNEGEIPLEVVVVQPSENPYHHPNILEQSARTEKMLNLASKLITPQTAFVVSPEAALPELLWLHQTQNNQSLLKIQDFLSQHQNLLWVTGASIYKVHSSGEKLPFSARHIPNTDTHYTIFNSAIMISHEQMLDYYHKSKLVPGIEAIPYVSVFRPLGSVFAMFGGTAKGLGKQNYRAVFKSENGAVVAPVICFESIFGHYMAEYARLGANVIFIMTNDGWWGNTPGHRQHNHYARLRAIELRKPIVRAASTGISSFIDQRGTFIQQTKWNEETAIRQTVNLNNRVTYFARNGNVIGKTSLFFSALVLIALLVQIVMNKKLKTS
jgi:apolipoprotein N-acyltransferase